MIRVSSKRSRSISPPSRRCVDRSTAATNTLDSRSYVVLLNRPLAAHQPGRTRRPRTWPVAHRMFAADPDLGARAPRAQQPQSGKARPWSRPTPAALPTTSAPPRSGRSRDRDGDHRHRAGHRPRAGRRRSHALPRSRDRSALITVLPRVTQIRMIWARLTITAAENLQARIASPGADAGHDTGSR